MLPRHQTRASHRRAPAAADAVGARAAVGPVDRRATAPAAPARPPTTGKPSSRRRSSRAAAGRPPAARLQLLSVTGSKGCLDHARKTTIALIAIGRSLGFARPTLRHRRAPPSQSRASIRSTSRWSSAAIMCSTSQPAGPACPSPSEARLRRLVRLDRLGYGDHIAVDDALWRRPGARRCRPRRRPNTACCSATARRSIAGERRAGHGARRSSAAAIAHVPGCPLRRNRHRARARPRSNYGCAINSNLAAMIADPDDLVHGQAGSARPATHDRDQGDQDLSRRQADRRRRPAGSVHAQRGGN